MLRTILLYGALLALGSLGLQWLQFRYIVRAHPVEAWLALIALVFLGLGIWAGSRLFRHAPLEPYETNSQAQRSLGISGRELEVLQLLASGQSNKQIAHQLAVSPNTVKTHIANLFDKLQVRRRTEAILRGRELGIIR